MKSFKDLKVEDTIYVYSKNNSSLDKIEEYTITVRSIQLIENTFYINKYTSNYNSRDSDLTFSREESQASTLETIHKFYTVELLFRSQILKEIGLSHIQRLESFIYKYEKDIEIVKETYKEFLQ